MKFLVTSGDYQTTLDRTGPNEAAKDAIHLWQHKKKKPDLSTITTVVGPDKTLYLSTTALIEGLA